MAARKRTKASLDTERFMWVAIECYIDSGSIVYTPDIIDRVFLFIEKDPELRSAYDRLIEYHGVVVNSIIAKHIKQRFLFRSLGKRSKATSSLIKTFQILK